MTRPDRTPLPYGSPASWWRLTLGLLVLGLLELLAGHLIIQRVLGDAAALVFDLVLGAVTVALFVVIASPLWASAHLDRQRSEVAVDLGLLGGARIPLATIRSVDHHRATVLEVIDPGAAVSGDPPRATFSRGGAAGFIRLQLTEPVEARWLVRRRTLVDEVLVQSGDPAAAIAAITQAISEAQAHG